MPIMTPKNKQVSIFTLQTTSPLRAMGMRVSDGLALASERWQKVGRSQLLERGWSPPHFVIFT